MALEFFKKASEINPEDNENLQNLNLVYFKVGNYINIPIQSPTDDTQAFYQAIFGDLDIKEPLFDIMKFPSNDDDSLLNLSN